MAKVWKPFPAKYSSVRLDSFNKKTVAAFTPSWESTSLSRISIQATTYWTGVKVDKVRTANRKGKPRRRGRRIGTTPAWKKAVVFLAPDHHIDLF